MKITIVHKTVALLIILLGWVFSLVAGQYYYFDAPASFLPYKQWCDAQLKINATTAGNLTWAKAGLVRLQLDPNRFSYNTSDIASVLQTELFVANTASFNIYSNPTVYPTWVDPAKTILQIDRYNTSTNFVGIKEYGTIKFTPNYFPTTYTGTFSVIYNGDTVMTSLSYGGENIIISWQQIPQLTGYYYVEQLPCVNDSTPPAHSITPSGWTKKSHLSGVQLSLTENVGGGSVPYVRTGGLPEIGTWTGNTRGLNNQYGVNFSTFQLFMSGNGQTRYFTGGMFSSAGDLITTPSGRTWQFRDRNYSVTIASSQLFDYGIEKTITITWRIADRNNNTGTISVSFNNPVGPSLIAWSRIPDAGATLVPTTSTVKLWIQDDRAGVNSGSIIVTLSGINGTHYGPYTFTGNDLNLSGVWWVALQPDYYITINSHPEFPSSWTIRVSVYAEDMAGNEDTINDYQFRTKPSCADYGCFHNVYLQYGDDTPFLYDNFSLSVLWGIDPSFTINGDTGTLYCGMENETALNIYKWTEELSGSATHISYHDLSELTFSGASNVKAVLSGNTLYLEKTYTPPGGGWWGWGWSTPKDDCLLPSDLPCANEEGIDYSDSFYDNTCCAPTTWHGAAPECDITDSPYTDQELNEAFQRAYRWNITNKCPITEARLEYPIIRMEAAKMISMFTMQVLGIHPNTNKAWCDEYPDIMTLSPEMRFFAKTSCQLDLMGLKHDGKTPDELFNPKDKVTRAQFGTMLSRLIYGDKYNIYEGEEEKYQRYEKHLNALNKDNIMKKIEKPLILEERGRVMLMFYRIVQENLTEKYRLIAPLYNGALVLLESIF